MLSSQVAWCDDKELKICIISFKLELKCVFFIKIWDSQDFIHSPKLIKYIFREARIQQQVINNQVLIFIIGIKKKKICFWKGQDVAFPLLISPFSDICMFLFYFILFGIERILVNHCFYQSRSLDLGINSTYGV
jgi:hypothetical protein